MERRGLLRRDTDGENHRSVRVFLTEEGKALAALSPEEAEALRAGLAKVLAELEGEV